MEVPGCCSCAGGDLWWCGKQRENPVQEAGRERNASRTPLLVKLNVFLSPEGPTASFIFPLLPSLPFGLGETKKKN